MLAASLEWPSALSMARRVSMRVDLTAGSDKSRSSRRLSKRLESPGLDLRRTGWRDRSQAADLLSYLGPGTAGCSTIGDPLYDSLQQQGIHGLLKVLSAVSGLEADGLMGELRSMLECNAHPVLDNAGGPAVAQQTPPVRGKVCQASPHLGPVNVVWLRKPQKTCQASCGCQDRVGGGLPCRRQRERAAPVSLFSGSWWQ